MKKVKRNDRKFSESESEQALKQVLMQKTFSYENV